MEELIASGKTDIVELGRQSLADPDLPIKARMGRDEDVNQCMRCFTCFSCSTVNGIFYCAINPRVGHELENKYAVPPRKRKKVLVAGGGIGGMQAALTAAERGHEVILCEKSGKLGGAIRCEKNVPFKRNMELYLERQEKAIRNSGIDLRMNTEVTPELAKQLKADVIIAATGAKPVKPKIPGIDGKIVESAENAYLHPEILGEKVCILGAGLVGLELAIYLAMQGKQVQVLELMPQLNDGGNFLHAIGLRAELKKQGVKVAYETKAAEIRDGGVLAQSKDGEVFFPANKVIYAVGQRAESEAAMSLRFCAPEFYQIGDCLSPRNITCAVSEAFHTARNIGRI
jgi:NADPH-dependent 2,4-dienoyl-CoA reductase/sulfur reductase-like enzyme